jgi:hypothetical protein
MLTFVLAQPGILKPGSTAFPSGQPKKTWQRGNIVTTKYEKVGTRI